MCVVLLGHWLVSFTEHLVESATALLKTFFGCLSRPIRTAFISFSCFVFFYLKRNLLHHIICCFPY